MFRLPLPMQSCPRCQTPVESTAIQCPRCRLTLKAHGHPGIPLHRATGQETLCATCCYDADDTCNFPQRPEAQTCTLYRSVNAPMALDPDRPSPVTQMQQWLRQHRGLIALAGLILISLLLVLAQQ